MTDREIQITGMGDVEGLLNWMAHQEPLPAGWTPRFDDTSIYWDNRENELRTPYADLIPLTLPVEYDSIAGLTRKYLMMRLGPDPSKEMFQEFCGTHPNGTTKLGNFYQILMNFGGCDITKSLKGSVHNTIQGIIIDWHTDNTFRPSLAGEDY